MNYIDVKNIIQNLDVKLFIHIKNSTDIVIKFKNKHNHRTDHISTVQEESRKKLKEKLKILKNLFQLTKNS